MDKIFYTVSILVFWLKLPQSKSPEIPFYHQFVERSSIYKIPNLLLFLHFATFDQNILHFKCRNSKNIILLKNVISSCSKNDYSYWFFWIVIYCNSSFSRKLNPLQYQTYLTVLSRYVMNERKKLILLSANNIFYLLICLSIANQP